MKSMSTSSIPVPAKTSWLSKLRAMALEALELHLRTCELLLEASRRPQR
ncbi:hypothetical protein [Pararobbsia alpina]|uniref:Uncharacterized protein n=1 Tax=Pararobbsia alpina TaxID=621374 RepID=A0A6S7CZZ6_9BURK|nr:hypothetical protein [Pararobbsia alpina]CAB3802257.1 hypothetical protein LMG28138_05160 [Pararobbsia alpina]